MIKILLVERIYAYFEILLFYEIVVFSKEIEVPVSFKEKTVDTRFADTIVKLTTPVSILIAITVIAYTYLTQNR